MALDQDTINTAGIGDKFDARIAGLEGRQGEQLGRSAALAGKQQEIAGEEEKLIAERGRETQAPREALIAKVRDKPGSDVGEKPIPQYERPQMDPKDLHDTFGALMVAATLVGVATRGAYSGIMGAMTGALEGFTKADHQMVEDSLKVYDKNLASIKEQNSQKRRAVEDAWKKYSNDLVGLKTELELIASKYDDPLALQAARSKSLSETQKLIDANIRSIDTAIQRLEATRASIEGSRARQAEASARFAQSEERLQLARERAAKADEERSARLNSRQFKDEQSLRKEYEVISKPLQKEGAEIDRILYYADHPQAFSDVQLRQAVSQFQKGARGTNAMIASMTNFGSLDERIAGHFSRFFEGVYEPEQRADIKNLFIGLRDKVVKPALDTEQARFRYLATQNKFNPDHIILPPGGGLGVQDPTQDEIPVTVTPRP